MVPHLANLDGAAACEVGVVVTGAAACAPDSVTSSAADDGSFEGVSDIRRSYRAALLAGNRVKCQQNIWANRMGLNIRMGDTRTGALAFSPSARSVHRFDI